MTALWILIGIFLFFAFLFTLPLHVIITANDDVSVIARVLCFRYSLFPVMKRRKKRKKTKKSGKKAASSTQKRAKKSKKTKKKRTKKELWYLIRLLFKIVTAVLKKLPRSVRIRLETFEITVATGDAAKTAVLYGAVSGLAWNLFDILKNNIDFKVRKRASVGVEADFLGEKSRANIKIDLSTNLWKILALLMTAGIAFVKNKTKPET